MTWPPSKITHAFVLAINISLKIVCIPFASSISELFTLSALHIKIESGQFHLTRTLHHWQRTRETWRLES